MIDRKKTKYIQGVAIMLMIIHHYVLYGIDLNEYSKLGKLILESIGWTGKLRVSIFLLCSGIGMYYKKNTIKDGKIVNYCVNKVFNLYKSYIIILFIFLPFLYFIGYKIDIYSLLLHLLTINSDFNNSWWFLNTYLLIILTFPIFIRYDKKNNLLKISVCIMMVGYILNILNTIFKTSLFENSIFSSVYLFLINQFPFWVGFIFAKNSKILNKIEIHKLSQIIITICIITITRSILRKFNLDNVLTDTFLSFLLVYILCKKPIFSNFFVYFGKHSTGMWLSHLFFIMLLNTLNLSNISVILGLLIVIVLSLIVDYLINKKYFTE